jgi:hypothetical protein
VDEPLRPDDSRYAQLANWLQQQPAQHKKLALTFKQIEEIIGEDLPASARQHRSWWENDPVAHTHSRQWIEVGWRVAVIAMSEENVTFARIKDRERNYISFYSGVLQDVRKDAPFSVRGAGPDGLSWVTIAKVPTDGPSLGSLGYCFARYGRFRVEFYIDSGEKERNKHLFDLLYQRREEIQAALSSIEGSLEWERIDDKRASRIALYHDGAITEPPEKLSGLRLWAVEAMIRFQEVINQWVNEVMQTVP